MIPDTPALVPDLPSAIVTHLPTSATLHPSRQGPVALPDVDAAHLPDDAPDLPVAKVIADLTAMRAEYDGMVRDLRASRARINAKIARHLTEIDRLDRMIRAAKGRK